MTPLDAILARITEIEAGRPSKNSDCLVRDGKLYVPFLDWTDCGAVVPALCAALREATKGLYHVGGPDAVEEIADLLGVEVSS